ncbi:hypothetical protein DOT_0889 [Desulfosporosinus sp. OT]|nr:hypothetical protein DOT_0889 [Desulfosporosinus sp. OT]
MDGEKGPPSPRLTGRLIRAKTVSARRVDTCEDSVFVGTGQVFFRSA